MTQTAATKIERYNAKDILFQVFGWGWGDTQAVLDAANDFDVDLNEIDFEEEPVTGVDGLNSVIARIFQAAVEQNGFDPYDERVSIYTNSIDSHLNIDNEEVFNLEDLKKAIEKLQPEDAEDEDLETI